MFVWGDAPLGRLSVKGTSSTRGLNGTPDAWPYTIAAADVFIHASKDEAFGKTIAEAMACGTPVVATAVGGIPELLDDGVTGYLVPKGDSSAMSERAQHLLDDEALRQRIGTRARHRSRERFDLNRQVEEFLGWYQEILAREGVLHARDDR